MLESPVRTAYPFPMDDTPRRENPPDWEAPMPTGAELVAALDESDAEAEAGLFVDGDEIIRELYADAERLEAEQSFETTNTPDRL
jgi:hypothetical protein